MCTTPTPTVRRASRVGSGLRSSVGGNNSRHDDGGYSASRVRTGTASRSAAVNPINTFDVPMRMSTMLPAYHPQANDSAARHANISAVAA